MKRNNNLMTQYLLLIVSVLLTLSCTHTPVLYLVGDSTMSDKPDADNPERGWGMLLPDFFNESIAIENHAKNGRSSRSFIYEGRWDSLMTLVKRGDYVVIQFGHNDGVMKKITRYCTPEEYRYNLSRFILDAKTKSVNPILCTPILRRKFDSTGQVIHTHGVYPDIVRELALEYDIPLVDMEEMSAELIMEYGQEGSKELFLHIGPGVYQALPEGKLDNTHLSEFGARKIAGLFIQGLLNTNHELTTHLKRKQDAN